MPTSRDILLEKYKLHKLKALEDFVAEAVEVCQAPPVHPGEMLKSFSGQRSLQQ
jgi:hypothetical protein